jgi:hypothetical protein
LLSGTLLSKTVKLSLAGRGLGRLLLSLLLGLLLLLGLSVASAAHD